MDIESIKTNPSAQIDYGMLYTRLITERCFDDWKPIPLDSFKVSLINIECQYTPRNNKGLTGLKDCQELQKKEKKGRKEESWSLPTARRTRKLY